MARSTLFLIGLIIFASLINGESRLLLTNAPAHSSSMAAAAAAGQSSNGGGDRVMNIIEGLYMEAIKTGGPSDGRGHQFTNSEILGEKKNFGPSPLRGH